MGDMLARSRIFQYLAAATPGLKELVTVGKIWELAQLDRRTKGGRKYDLVIVDAPATGHGIGFLQSPRTFASIARVGPIASQGQALHRFITDGALTGAAIVSLPEEMPVNETAALEAGLRDEIGVAVDRVYMNALYPERFDEGEVARLEKAAGGKANGTVTAALEAALSERRRVECQREQLQRLRGMVETPITTLPFMFAPQIGEGELETLAQCPGFLDSGGFAASARNDKGAQ
jgi:anion-transporting  ArsA/GET3 family ATPase